MIKIIPVGKRERPTDRRTETDRRKRRNKERRSRKIKRKNVRKAELITKLLLGDVWAFSQSLVFILLVSMDSVLYVQNTHL